MNDDLIDKEDCISFFGDIGLTAVSIPELPGIARTPDLRVDNDRLPYLVEIKTRRSSEEWSKNFSSKEIYESKAPWGTIAWPFKAARNALDQFESFDPNQENIWILWISVRREQDRDIAFEQIMDSLLGVRHFLADFGDGECISKRCIDAHQSVFEKYKSLDFAIVSSGTKISAFLNERGCRLETCRSLVINGAFADRGKVNSISSLVADGWWIYDGQIGATHKEIAEYLRDKYKTSKVLPSEMTTHSLISHLTSKENLQ